LELYSLTAEARIVFIFPFLERALRLIMEICLPLIKSSQEEIIEFKEDPVQFVEIALDACQGQVTNFDFFPYLIYFFEDARNNKSPSNATD